MYQKGFNRIEVLVLVTIVIIILGVFINFIFDVQKSVRDSKRKADIETIAKQSEIHFNRHPDEFCPDASVDSYCYPQSAWFENNKVPRDPLTGQPYLNLPKDNDKKFMICAKLEKESNSLGTERTPPGVNSGVYYCSSGQQ